MDYEAATAKVPLGQRINFRIIVFALVMLVVIGYPIYLFVKEDITGGIVDRGDYKEVNLQAMSVFPFDQQNGRMEDIPQKWRDLDGKKVMLQGEMYAPGAASDELRRFDLVYSISKCCFNGPPQVQHFVKSTVVGNKTVTYYSQQVRVMGTLHVNVKKGEAGGIESVYTLDVDNVQPM
jgi:hypothetical protein